MAAELAKPETTQTLLEEARALSKATKRIDAAFIRVSNGLAEVDRNDFTAIRAHGAEVSENSYQFSNSRTGAKSDYGDSSYLVPPGSNPLTVTQAQSQGFIDLKAEIEAFGDAFGLFATFREGEMVGEVADLADGINILATEIDITELYKRLCSAIGGTLEGATMASALVIMSLSTIGPTIATGVIVGAIAIIGELTAVSVFPKKTSNATKGQPKKKDEKAELKKQLKQLQKLKSKLEAQTWIRYQA
ncbi:hypothetical protein CTheo_6391 [Ceratobasidium theobromae]|uniref:Transmembrane protein n=1 Tax=Ceratobasidium theobromae TaxID=1582974 RepID=A0A5N5QF74_9AGAM|nr:hypothetical protein CTheo_6391 [Ceratobasidium theobromae]